MKLKLFGETIKYLQNQVFLKYFLYLNEKCENEINIC